MNVETHVTIPVILVFQGSFCQMNRLEMDGVYSYARLHGWRIQIVEYDTAAVNRFQLGKRASQPDVAALLKFWRPAGCIVECAGRAPEFTQKEFSGVPTVFLDRHPSTVHKGAICIYSDTESIVQCAARELLSLGFAHYAYLPWPEETVWSRERGENFGRLARMNGKTFSSFSPGKSFVNMLAIQQHINTWVQELPRPCGVLAANDAMAERLVAVCAAAGVSIPEQIAVVGVDDEETLCENAAVTISSVRPDYEKAGFRAAALLDAVIRHPGCIVNSETFGALRVTRRASTRLIRSADARVLRAIDVIRRRACDGLTPPEVVAEMGCSRRLADLRFREATGHTILDEIHSIRLQKVKDLLACAYQNTSAIPVRCGYSSLVDLRRVFKRRVGMTMSEWRRLNIA